MAQNWHVGHHLVGAQQALFYRRTTTVVLIRIEDNLKHWLRDRRQEPD